LEHSLDLSKSFKVITVDILKEDAYRKLLCTSSNLAREVRTRLDLSHLLAKFELHGVPRYDDLRKQKQLINEQSSAK